MYSVYFGESESDISMRVYEINVDTTNLLYLLDVGYSETAAQISGARSKFH